MKAYSVLGSHHQPSVLSGGEDGIVKSSAGKQDDALSCNASLVVLTIRLSRRGAEVTSDAAESANRKITNDILDAVKMSCRQLLRCVGQQEERRRRKRTRVYNANKRGGSRK